MKISFFSLLGFSLVELLQKTCWGLLLVLAASVLLESIHAVISQNLKAVVWGDVVVKVTCIDKVPFSFMDIFISFLNFSVNRSEVGHSGVLSEMIRDIDFGLNGSKSVQSLIVMGSTFRAFRG